jgi:hypothetical protein
VSSRKNQVAERAEVRVDSTRHGVSSRIRRKRATRQWSVEWTGFCGPRDEGYQCQNGGARALCFAALRSSGASYWVASSKFTVELHYPATASVAGPLFTSIPNTTIQISGVGRRHRLSIGAHVGQCRVQQKSCPVGLSGRLNFEDRSDAPGSAGDLQILLQNSEGQTDYAAHFFQKAEDRSAGEVAATE